MILEYKLELQKLDFWMIKITQTRFQKSHLSLLTLSITVSKNSLKHPNHSLSHLNTQTLSSFKHWNPHSTGDNPLIGGHSFRHPNLHSTKDAPFIGNQKTFSQNPVNLTLLSLPFCQNPSLFVSFQHLTNKSSDFFHRAPKFQFLSYVFLFICSFIVGPIFFVLLMDFIWFVPIFCFINSNPGPLLKNSIRTLWDMLNFWWTILHWNFFIKLGGDSRITLGGEA